MISLDLLRRYQELSAHGILQTSSFGKLSRLARSGDVSGIFELIEPLVRPMLVL